MTNPDGTISLGQLEAEACTRLGSADLPDAGADARRIIEEAAGLSAAELVLAREQLATERVVAAVDQMVARRSSGEPLQYVLGRWGFRSLDLMVDRRVLIPRPETEQLVDVALSALAATGGPPVVVDLGTGSGAVGLSIATELAAAEVWLTDASSDALAVASANLVGLGMAARRVTVVAGDWFEALPGELAGRVSLVVSNPPYIGTEEELEPVVADWEPSDALRSGPEGLDDLRVILEGSPRWLVPGGVVAVEIGATQGAAVAEIARSVGLGQIEVLPDLTGRDRFLRARFGG